MTHHAAGPGQLRLAGLAMDGMAKQQGKIPRLGADGCKAKNRHEACCNVVRVEKLQAQGLCPNTAVMWGSTCNHTHTRVLFTFSLTSPQAASPPHPYPHSQLSHREPGNSSSKDWLLEGCSGPSPTVRDLGFLSVSGCGAEEAGVSVQFLGSAGSHCPA